VGCPTCCNIASTPQTVGLIPGVPAGSLRRVAAAAKQSTPGIVQLHLVFDLT